MTSTTSELEEQDRIAALEELELVDTPPEERFDRVVRLAQHLFGVPYAALNLVGDDRHYTKAAGSDLFGGAASSLPRSHSLCALTVQDDHTLEITDLRADAAFADHPLTGGSDIRYYAGAPLRAPGGQRIGSLCLIDVEPRDALDEREQTLLRDLANWLERELAIGADLEQGAELQRRLLPRTIPDLPGWEVAGRCMQAGAVGGDFYDWQLIPGTGQVQVVLADVMGKGIRAALLAAGVRAILRGASPHNSLEASITRVADDMQDDLGESASFVTLFAARFDPRDGALEYVDAGHGLAFLVGPDRGERLAGDGLPLGAVPGATWTPAGGQVHPGEALVLVSDGFLDVHDDKETVLEVVRSALATSDDAESLAATLAGSAVGTLASDDVTVVVALRGEPAAQSR